MLVTPKGTVFTSFTVLVIQSNPDWLVVAVTFRFHMYSFFYLHSRTSVVTITHTNTQNAHFRTLQVVEMHQPGAALSDMEHFSFHEKRE